MTAAEALAGFLTALGVPGPDIPLELDQRAARYRTQIVGRRMLVVLDNAATVEQVRPLLPGTPSCVVLVTSRDSLAGLVAVHGAHRLDLDLLPPADAVTLLRTLIGGRADADPDATTRLAELCARLPLALRVAAELAVSRPATRLADLGILADRAGRHESAADHFRLALTVSRQARSLAREAYALNSLGCVEVRTGRHESAADHLEQALILFRQIGDLRGAAHALDNLGTLHTRLRRLDNATEYFQQALTLFCESGDRDGEAWVLISLGEAFHAAGNPADALLHHNAALTVATDIGGRPQQARAHTGLGHAHHALGSLTRAREHYERALALHIDLGSPDADQVRAHLANITHS